MNLDVGRNFHIFYRLGGIFSSFIFAFVPHRWGSSATLLILASTHVPPGQLHIPLPITTTYRFFSDFPTTPRPMISLLSCRPSRRFSFFPHVPVSRLPDGSPSVFLHFTRPHLIPPVAISSAISPIFFLRNRTCQLHSKFDPRALLSSPFHPSHCFPPHFQTRIP